MEKEKKTNIISTIGFSIILLILLLIFYSRYIGIKGLIVKETKIESTLLPSQYSGLKIVHFSDVFYGSTFNEKELEALVKKINSLKPDVIVFTGNLIFPSYNLKEEEKEKIIIELKKMSSTLGNYSIKGTYDDEFVELMRDSDFTVLENKCEDIFYDSEMPIIICGVTDISGDLQSIYDFENPNDYYKIMITNKGDNSIELLKNDIAPNLILAGNSLGGSVVLPFYGPLFLPKGSKNYYGYHYIKNETNIFISSGLGTNEYRFRFLNKPSFNLYRLKSI